LVPKTLTTDIGITNVITEVTIKKVIKRVAFAGRLDDFGPEFSVIICVPLVLLSII
jgi:hypothetical protein